MEQRSAISADGTRIVWTTLGAGKGVAVYPGSLSDGSDWLPVAQHLAAEMTVHVISRRGTGPSGDAREHSLHRESEDVVSVLAATGASRLVGHSYGAVVCLKAALTYRALDRLVIYEPPLAVAAPFVSADALEEIERAAARGDIETVVDVGLRRCVKLPDAAVDALRATPIWTSMVVNGRRWAREIRALADKDPGVEEYSGITAGTLLLVGDKTPPGHHHREAVEALARIIPGARLLELGGVGHDGHLRDPKALSTILMTFLR